MSSLIRSCLAAFAVVAVVECAMGAPVASAQELPTTGHYVCCKCGSFFEHDEWTWGLDRSVIALCPDCAAEYEADYGSLEEAAAMLAEDIRGMHARSKQKRSAYNDWVERYDAARDSIWGFQGSLAKTSVSMLGIAAAGAGGSQWKSLAKASQGLQWTQTGLDLAQGPDDWMNWAGAGTEIFGTGPLLEMYADEFFQDAIKNAVHTYQQTGDAHLFQSQIGRAAAERMGVSNFAEGLNKYSERMNQLGAFLDLIGCLRAAWDMGNAIADWRLAWKNTAELDQELKDIDDQIEALGNMRQCILGEIERRNNDDGDGGGDGGGDVRSDHLSANLSLIPAWQDPPLQNEDSLELEPLEPLREPDGPHPADVTMWRASQQIEALKAKIEETQVEFARDVLPNSLVLLAIAVQGNQEHAGVVSRLCAETLPAFRTFETDVADILRDCRTLIQDLHEDTVNLGENEEDRARFKFLNSSVTFQIADWVPALESWGWSGVVPAGAGAKGRIDIESIDGLRLLPAGSYDVMWAPGYAQYEQPVLLAKALDIKDGDIVEIRVDSGARIEAAVWVQPLDGSWGWWGAAPAGDPGGWNARINWHERGDVPLVLPPGNYDIYWAQGFYQRDTPVRIASNITIGAGELKAIRVNTGVRLNDLPVSGTGVSGTGDPPVVLPAFDPNWGWWAVVPVGGGEDDWINYSRGVLTQPLVVPPGTYDILYDAGLSSETVRFAENVVVKEGQLVSIPVR